MSPSRKFKTSLLFIAAISAAITGCGSTENEVVATDIIGSAGGTVEANDGTVAIEIPAGALSADVEISITTTSSVPSGGIGQAYNIGPDGTIFATPARITLRYPSDLSSDTASSSLRAATVENGAWSILTNDQLDEGSRKVSGETLHLSPFGVFKVGSGTDCATPCTGENDGLSCSGCEGAVCGGAGPSGPGNPGGAAYQCTCAGGLWNCGEPAPDADAGSGPLCATPCAPENDGLSCAGCEGGGESGPGFCAGVGPAGSYQCTCATGAVWNCTGP